MASCAADVIVLAIMALNEPMATLFLNDEGGRSATLPWRWDPQKFAPSRGRLLIERKPDDNFYGLPLAKISNSLAPMSISSPRRRA
jgi:hypothetical protein